MISPRLLSLLTAAASAVTLHAEKLPLITKEEVGKSLEANGAAWKAAIMSKSPRLYFTEAEWPKVVEQISAMPAPRQALVPFFFAAMDKLVSDPLPVYQTPEQMVGKRGDAPSLYAAQEELWEREVGNQIFALAVAARLKPEGPYRQKMHDMVMATLTFDTWGRAQPPMGNNSDLSAGHVTRGIAVAYDWHHSAFTEEELSRIRQVIAERVPCLLNGLYGNAFWGGGYGENHNHVSVTGLAYCGVALYNEIPEAPTWLAAARLDFQNVLQTLPGDGSSYEGASYWGYGISFILQYIEGTRQVIDSADLYQSPFLKNAAAFRMLAATPGLLGVLPWGDSVVRGWSSPNFVLYRLAAQYNDPAPAWFADQISDVKGGADEKTLTMLWARNAPVAQGGELPLDGRLWVNDMVNSRTGWKQDDYILCFKAGPTNRNHSHLDAGALALGFGDEWLLAAPGYGGGSSQGAYWDSRSDGTRWTFFSNSTESHTALLINGQNQDSSREAQGSITQFFSSPRWMWASADLTKAYRDVKNVTRQVLHRRGDYVLVFDSVSTPQPATVEWLAQFRSQPKVKEEDGLLVEGKNGSLRLKMLEPDQGFVPRKPSSPKVDAKGTYLSYAVSESGAQTEFVALLQPVKNPREIPLIHAAVKKGLFGDFELTIPTKNWTDEVVKRAGPGDLKAGSATARGSLLTVRTKGTAFDSALALNATALKVPGLSFAGRTPCDLAVEKKEDGSWLVTGSRELKEEIAVTDGKAVTVKVSRP